MKKKLLLLVVLVAVFVCVLAISASAEALTNYASVKLTLVDGTEAVGYCKIDGRFLRDNVYKNPENTDEGTYAWGDIKVFDMRDSVIVGTKTYNEVGGTNCNGQAVNVEEFYFSSQVTKILNTTFTSGWKSLKTVYIPKSVTCIANGFSNSPVCQVIFEEGSQLKTIEGSAFQGCANLTTFDFPEGLESLGRNCFFQSGLSGTIVIPNSVTKLDAGSLLSTKIENLYLGDGALEIGYNFLGTFGRKDNAYLKNVYMSASTTFTQTNIFYKCANPVNFYVIGTDAECAAMIETLKGHSTGDYMTFITADEVTEDTGAGYGIIHTGYNRCTAFYNGEHSYENGICTRCGDALYCENPEHNLEISITYVSYMAEGIKTVKCLDCNSQAREKIADPLFDCLGYSASETGDNGIVVGYTVNKTAVTEYEKYEAVALEYGVFAVSQEKLGDNAIFGENGAAKGVISADVTNHGFALFELKIVGFADEQKGLKLAMGAYVAVNDGETTEYSYMQDDKKGEKIGEYFFVTYNEVVAK